MILLLSMPQMEMHLLSVSYPVLLLPSRPHVTVRALAYLDLKENKSGYLRVVYGDHGPYAEFDKSNMHFCALTLNTGKTGRLRFDYSGLSNSFFQFQPVLMVFLCLGSLDFASLCLFPSCRSVLYMCVCLYTCMYVCTYVCLSLLHAIVAIA